MNSNIIPIYIENYLSISKTFIYRQLAESKELGTKIILTSSKPENLELFPHPDVYTKSKNIIELLVLKFYEKVLRDRFFSRYYRVLSFGQKKYFSSILNNPNIKFIHAHFGTAALEIYKISQKLNKKLLISFHGIDASNLLKSKSYCNNLRLFFAKSYVIVPSDYMRKRLEREIGEPKEFYTIHYGIPLEFFNYIERKLVSEKMRNNEKIVFLQVSNFVEKKGHQYTIEAFAKLFAKYTNIELILAGDGPLKKEIEKQVRHLGIDSVVKFTGRVNQKQVKELFASADIFLHHSITAINGDQEGIPNVIMEAMASGLPVISTKHAGIPELVKDGVNGFLVDEKDINEYMNKMKLVLLSTDKTISQNARKTIETKFNIKIQLKKLHNIYKFLLEDEDKHERE